jgi:alpha-beta hydrolase superfamily lysophospholipase
MKEIKYKQWGLSNPKAILILVHGLGAHAGRWDGTGEFFAKNGISSYAIELENISHRGYFRNYYDQIVRLRQIAVKANPGIDIFIVGESMGALISFLLVSKYPRLFKGLICLSPAFASKRVLPFSQCVKVFTALFYNPGREFRLPFDSSDCTRDGEYVKRLDSDPREYRKITSKLIAEIILSQSRVKVMKNKMTIPVLFLVAGSDLIVDQKATMSVFKGLAVKDKSLAEFPEMYHSLSIDTGRESVFEEMSRWIKGRIA